MGLSALARAILAVVLVIPGQAAHAHAQANVYGYYDGPATPASHPGACIAVANLLTATGSTYAGVVMDHPTGHGKWKIPTTNQGDATILETPDGKPVTSADGTYALSIAPDYHKFAWTFQAYSGRGCNGAWVAQIS